MVDLYFKELYENNQYSRNQYTQMMRMLPHVLEKPEYNSEEYFKFFMDSEYQVNNDDVDRNDDLNDDELEDDFFSEDAIPEFITFNTFLPA